MTMLTSIGTKAITRRAADTIDQHRILAYGTDENTVKTAGAGEVKLAGISAPNGQYSSPSPCNDLLTRPGMVVDVLYTGVAICVYGTGTVAYGDPVKPDAEGRAIRAVANDTAIGTCETPGGEGLPGRVKIRIHKV
jgi:hypothetical protein